MVRRQSKRKPRKAPAAADQTLSASRSDSETIVEQSSSVAGQAKAFADEFVTSHAAIIDRFDVWLLSLEGRKFPVAVAEREITAINHAVVCAARRLFYHGKPVTLYCDTAARRKNAKIIVATIGIRPQQRLYEKVEFPPLGTRPLH